MDDDDDLLLEPASKYHTYPKEKIKTIALAVSSIAFLVSLSLLIWQASLPAKVITREVYINNTINNNTQPLVDNWVWLREDISSKMDHTADPCNDFYSYVCGAYEANTVLRPDEKLRIEVFSVVEEIVQQIISDIADGQWPLIGDVMSSCMMNTTDLQIDTLATFDSLINEYIYNVVNSTSPDVLLPALAKLHMKGIDAFFGPDVLDNIYEDDSDNHLQLYMSGLTLPIQAYHYGDYNKTYESLTEFVDIVLQLLVPDTTTERAMKVVDLEYEIANITIFESEDIEDYIQVTTFEELRSRSGIDYTKYANSLTLPFELKNSDTVVLMAYPFFENLTALLERTPLETVLDYLVFRTVSSVFDNPYPVFGSDTSPPEEIVSVKKANTLNPKQSKNIFSKKTTSNIFKNIFETINEPEDPQRKACLKSVDALLGDFVGLLFSTMIVDKYVVDDIRTITTGIQAAFHDSLDDLTWISAESKQAARQKLSQIIQIIGHANKLERYRGVLLNPSRFLENILLVNEYHWEDYFLDIGRPFNRSDFEFSALDVNAFYSPWTNTINFPAGILESPIFSTSFPKMLQYARIGYVIGHETVHGFDNSGHLWNGHGAYKNIMDAQSDINFNTQAECIVNQFDAFPFYPGATFNVSGQQTLGENIADLGGAKNAFRAYKKWIATNNNNTQEFLDFQIVPTLTNDQLFFVMLGQTWCTKGNNTEIEEIFGDDPHSPSMWRVNGPLANFDEFAKAFKCNAGSKMVHNPQCVLW